MLRFAARLGPRELFADHVIQVDAETRQHGSIDKRDPTVEVAHEREEIERIEHPAEPVLGLLSVLLRFDHRSDVAKDRQVSPRNEVRCGVVVTHDHLAVPTTNMHPAAFAFRAHERRPMIQEDAIILDHVVSDPASDQVVAINAEHTNSSRIGVDIRTIVVSDKHPVSSALEKCPITSVLVVHNHPAQWPPPCDLSVSLVFERRSCDPLRF